MRRSQILGLYLIFIALFLKILQYVYLDYQLPKNWQPKTNIEWERLITRCINYGDIKRIPKEKLIQLFPKIKLYLDEGKRLMYEDYLSYYGAK